MFNEVATGWHDANTRLCAGVEAGKLPSRLVATLRFVHVSSSISNGGKRVPGACKLQQINCSICRGNVKRTHHPRCLCKEIVNHYTIHWMDATHAAQSSSLSNTHVKLPRVSLASLMSALNRVVMCLLWRRRTKKRAKREQ